MNRIQELKKKLQCQKCKQNYSERSRPYIISNCGHHTCGNCEGYCPICGRSAYGNQAPFPYDAYIQLNALYESTIASKDKDEKHLRMQISTLEQEKAKWDASREDHYKCGECGSSESEQNVQLCATCHNLKFKDLQELEKHALCSACAIKKHIRQGHQIVDFYPYLSAFNLLSHTPKIKSEAKQFEKTRDSLNHMFSDFNALSINVSENYDVLTDIARRSKSTKNQLELIGKMETFINESKSIHSGAATELKNRTKLLQESVKKIKDWYKDKMADCVDESEVIKLDIPAVPKTKNNNNNTATRKSQRKRARQ